MNPESWEDYFEQATALSIPAKDKISIYQIKINSHRLGTSVHFLNILVNSHPLSRIFPFFQKPRQGVGIERCSKKARPFIPVLNPFQRSLQLLFGKYGKDSETMGSILTRNRFIGTGLSHPKTKGKACSSGTEREEIQISGHEPFISLIQ